MLLNISSKFSFRFFKRMSLDKILSTQEHICKELETLKNEVFEVEKLLKIAKIKTSAQNSADLAKENAFLEEEINKTKAELIRLESLRGIKQIPIPERGSSTVICAPPVESKKPVEDKKIEETISEEIKPKKEGKKKEKQDNQKVTPSEGPVDVSRLDLRVGKIVDVQKHPDADSLYVEQIDVGKEKPITVVSGLVKHIPIEEMQGRSVVLLCNLKPAKMRGVTSEAMVMCASTPEKVEVLSPPAGALPGDMVEAEGFPPKPDAVLNPKKKIWETVSPELKTDNRCRATYRGAVLRVSGKGEITSQSLVDVFIK